MVFSDVIGLDGAAMDIDVGQLATMNYEVDVLEAFLTDAIRSSDQEAPEP